MGKKKSNLKSDCCNAEVKVGSIRDFEGDKSACTQYYVCTKCRDACNVHLNIRKTWKINPTTKIKGDEREKIRTKESNKEIQQIGNA